MRLALALLVLGMAACTTNALPGDYVLLPLSANGRDLTTVEGLHLKPTTLLESRLPGGTVVVRAAEGYERFGAAFVIGLQNKGGAPVMLDVSNVAARSGGANVPVMGGVQLEQQVLARTEAMVRAADSVGPDGTSRRSLQAATPNVRREERLNDFGGCGAGNGRCLVDSPDLGRGYRLDQSNRQANLELANEAGEMLLRDSRMALRALQPVMIAPGAIGGGVIVVPAPSPGQVIELTVSIAGEAHSFSYRAQPD